MDCPRLPRLSPIERLAPELLSKVALCVALTDDNQLGPPSCILPLTCTSRSLYRAISMNNNVHLLAGLFRARFDDAAFARRACMKIPTSSLASEYRKRCEALQRIRAGNIDEATLIEDLWTAYLMFIEHDEKNIGHLVVWANLHRYLMKLFRSVALDIQQILDISSTETTAMSLATYLLCSISNTETLHEETEEDRKVLIDTLQMLVLCGFRLPSFYAPDNDFRVQDLQVPESSRPPASRYDAQKFPTPKISCITHYACQINLRPPPISSYASLALVARYDFAQEEKVPPGFEALPADRAAANALGVTGPTQADVIEIMSRLRNKLPGMYPQGTGPFGRGSSRNHEEEWYQITSCFYLGTSGLRSSLLPPGRAFVPGQLCGLWAGKFAVPEWQSYRELVNRRPQSPIDNIPMYQRPIYIRLREHHYLDDKPVSGCATEPDSDGLLKAWFPKDIVLSEDREGSHLELYHTTSQTRRRYETYRPPQDGVGIGIYPGFVASKQKQKSASRRPYFACSPRCIPNECLACEGNVVPQSSGVADIVITGETDTNHAAAWGGPFTFTGRVRLWDGLIALLRKPTNPEDSGLGTWIFRGYISPSGVFTGRWRETATGMESPGWEGPFFLVKQLEKLES